jgi:hypothetical protein
MIHNTVIGLYRGSMENGKVMKVIKKRPEAAGSASDIRDRQNEAAVTRPVSDGPAESSKNPLGLKVEGNRPILVRRPAFAENKVPVAKAQNMSREEQMRRDRIESAKRYESLKLYDEAIKYYKMAGEEAEATRIQCIMNELYVAKAKEFELAGQFEEAANLYDILKMKDDYQRCKSKSEVKMPSLDVQAGDDVAVSAFRAMNNPALLVDPKTSPYIAAAHEHNEQLNKEIPVKKPKDELKAFTICPYCGEEINLPKQPKFCPYCREPFS